MSIVQAAQPRYMLTMLVAALIISTSSVWVKLTDMSPTVIGFYRMSIGGLLLLLMCWWQRTELWRGMTYFGWLLLGAFFFAIDLWVWHRSINYIGPGLATVLGNFQVFFMALFGVLFFSEKIGWKFMVGLGMTFAGLFLLVGMNWFAYDANYQLGVFFGLATAIAYTGFMLSLRHVQSQNHALTPVANLGILSLLCALILALQVFLEAGDFRIPNWQSGFSVLTLGVFCQVVGWLLITRSMPHLPTSVVGLLLLLQPAMSMVWDVLFFARPTGISDVMGLILVLCGIYLATLKRSASLPSASQSETID